MILLLSPLAKKQNASQVAYLREEFGDIVALKSIDELDHDLQMISS